MYIGNLVIIVLLISNDRNIRSFETLLLLCYLISNDRNVRSFDTMKHKKSCTCINDLVMHFETNMANNLYIHMRIFIALFVCVCQIHIYEKSGKS